MEDLPSMSKLIDMLGCPAAAVYVRLYDHYRKQKKQQGHFHAGRYWVRMPYKDFPRMFPGLSEAIVSEAFEQLEDKGLLSMIHHGRLSWYVMNRISRRVIHRM